MKVTLSLKAFLVGSINPQLAKIITKFPLNQLALSTIICPKIIIIMNNVSIESLFITVTNPHNLVEMEDNGRVWVVICGLDFW